MLQKLKDAPRRQQFVATAGLVVLALFVWAAQEKGLFEGVTFLIASASLLGLVQLLPARPKLRVTARQSDRPHLTVQSVVKPIDENTVVKEQVAEAMSEMPRQPLPRAAFGGPAQSALQAAMAAPGMSLLTGTYTDDDLRTHREEVRRYEAYLRNWLTNLEVARADRLRLFNGDLRLHELGHAPADHALLRLFFPEGFELQDEAPDINAPPKRPTRQTNWPGLLNLNPAIPRLKDGGLLDSLRHDDDEPQYGLKDGLPEITYKLGRINQSDNRPVPSFRLKAPRQSGTYQVQWEATAAGLTKPASGTLTIEVREPIEETPITSLEEAEKERDAFELY